MAHFRQGVAKLRDLAAGVEHGRVVATAEIAADFGKRRLVSSRPAPSRPGAAGRSRATSFSSACRRRGSCSSQQRFLDVLDRNLPILNREQIAQSILGDGQAKSPGPWKLEYAVTRFSAPRARATLERICLAMKNATCSSSFIPVCAALTAESLRASRARAARALQVRPHPNREMSRSSMPAISLGRCRR